MVKFYKMQIKMQKITIEDVPAKWREKVETELKKGEM